MRQTDKILRRLLELHPNKLIDLKLDRIERLLQALGRPQDRLPPTIHVAGTNAKGSTIAHLRAFVEAAGKQVHVYTSPHLVRFNERIRLAGKLVSDAQLQEALELCEKHNESRPITYFEITTAAAFHLFAEVKADYLLLEVGLGGRFDATNVIDRPLGSIITPVSIDHTEFLGSDLEAIALEKSGVLKRGAPAVIGRQPDAARAAIEAEAQKLGVQAKYFSQDFEGFEQYGRLVYQDETGLLDLPPSRLSGPFQIENAALAIAAARYFKLGLSEKHFAAGLRQVSWPGRMMRVKEGRLLAGLSGHQEIWLDGGHNVAGGVALATALRSMVKADKRPFVLVLGAYANKDPAGFLAPFARLVKNIVTVPISGDRQAWIPEELAELAQSLGFEAQPATSLETGLEKAAAIAGARIILCGSLHLVGQFLEENRTFPD